MRPPVSQARLTLEDNVTAPTHNIESAFTDEQIATIELKTRVHQLETLLAAEHATAARLREQRAKLTEAGKALMVERDDARRELAESRELVRAQALTLEELTNSNRQLTQRLNRLERGVEVLPTR